MSAADSAGGAGRSSSKRIDTAAAESVAIQAIRRLKFVKYQRISLYPNVCAVCTMFCTIYAVDITVPDCRSGRGQQKNASLGCAFGCTANLAGGLSSLLERRSLSNPVVPQQL